MHGIIVLSEPVICLTEPSSHLLGLALEDLFIYPAQIVPQYLFPLRGDDLTQVAQGQRFCKFGLENFSCQSVPPLKFF